MIHYLPSDIQIEEKLKVYSQKGIKGQNPSQKE
jgi:hypothetical protein